MLEQSINRKDLCEKVFLLLGMTRQSCSRKQDQQWVWGNPSSSCAGKFFISQNIYLFNSFCSFCVLLKSAWPNNINPFKEQISYFNDVLGLNEPWLANMTDHYHVHMLAVGEYLQGAYSLYQKIKTKRTVCLAYQNLPPQWEQSRKHTDWTK